MSLKIYISDEIKKAVEQSGAFSGTFPLEAALEPGMENLTLTELANRLQKQMKGAIGITLIEVSFAVIRKPQIQSRHTGKWEDAF